MDKTLLKKIKKEIDLRDHFIILVHSKPDGDALGSAYSLLLYFLNQNKKAVIGLEEDFVYKYKSFITPCDLKDYFVYYNNISDFNSFKTIVVLDCSTPKLLGLYQNFVLENKENLIVIDHHATSQSMSDLQYVDPKASSASEIILDLLEGESLDFEMAQAIYMGIVFDTGQFRHSNTTAGVFKKISFLIENFAISLEHVYYTLFENETIERKKVISKLIDTVEFYNDGKIAVSYLSLALIKELEEEGYKITEDDLIDLIGVPHSIKGVLVSCSVREKKDQINISFRSRCDFDVAEFASLFGGGGHEKASGLKLEKKAIVEIKETIISDLSQEFKKSGI